MIKTLILISMILILSSCGKLERISTHWTGNLTYKCSNNGIEYVQSDSGLAVHYKQNGSIQDCKQ